MRNMKVLGTENSMVNMADTTQPRHVKSPRRAGNADVNLKQTSFIILFGSQDQRLIT